MKVALDPLMHKSLQIPPLTITPTTIDTPLGESHTHVSVTPCITANLITIIKGIIMHQVS
jgi:hypothetical protein